MPGIARSTLTFSSRSASASNVAGGSIATSVSSCSRWFWRTSRERAGLLVERAAVADADRLGHRDLHVVDVAAVPERLEDAVAEAEDQEVPDGLLAQVVVDAVDLRLAEDLADLAVEPDRRLEVAAERLLDDDPPPAAGVVLVVEADAAELLDDLREGRLLGREVEEHVAACLAFSSSSSSRRVAERVEAAGVVEVHAHVARCALANSVQTSSSIGCTREYFSRAARISARNESSSYGRRPIADEHELVGQQVGPPELVERRHDLAMGQIAGRAEQDEDERVRHALKPEALAQRVGEPRGTAGDGARPLVDRPHLWPDAARAGLCSGRGWRHGRASPGLAVAASPGPA